MNTMYLGIVPRMSLLISDNLLQRCRWQPAKNITHNFVPWLGGWALKQGFSPSFIVTFVTRYLKEQVTKYLHARTSLMPVIFAILKNKRLIVNIPTSVDKSLLVAINGNRGKKYFSAPALIPGRDHSKTAEKQRKQEPKQ